jgi:hypothetical protein
MAIPMLIDLLAPLVAIPVVLLLAFAGCSLPNLYWPPGIQWGGGLQTDIESIEVAFGLDPDSGEDPSNLHPAPTTLTGQDLNDFFVNGLNVNDAAPWTAGSPGTLNCFCTIAQSNTAKTVKLLASMSFDTSEATLDGTFQLSRNGTAFDQSEFSLASRN